MGNGWGCNENLSMTHVKFLLVIVLSNVYIVVNDTPDFVHIKYNVQ